MGKKEAAQILRDDPSVHYNCCQAVLIPYAEECGLTAEQAGRLGNNFGGGMRHGGTCGALAGALMVLGMQGKGEAETKEVLRRFKEKNGCLDCAHLLKKAAEEGEPRKTHCDRMVAEAVELTEALLK